MTTTTEKTLVNYTTIDGVAVIEFTNPPANTYSHEMVRQLDEAILRARFDDNVHVLLLRGAGDKFFSAGAEISMLNAVTPGFKYYFCLHANETLTRLEQTPKLVIAALNGHTVGGGLEIALTAISASHAEGRARLACLRSTSVCFLEPVAPSAWRVPCLRTRPSN
jgi:enoyl-CoA hydratase